MVYKAQKSSKIAFYCTNLTRIMRTCVTKLLVFLGMCVFKYGLWRFLTGTYLLNEKSYVRQRTK